MASSEQETTILVNDGDMADGYFRFSTTKVSVFNRIAKRIGGNFIAIDRYPRDTEEAWCWNCKIPSKYLSKTTFAIKAPNKLSDEKREALRARALVSGFKSKATEDS